MHRALAQSVPGCEQAVQRTKQQAERQSARLAKRLSFSCRSPFPRDVPSIGTRAIGTRTQSYVQTGPIVPPCADHLHLNRPSDQLSPRTPLATFHADVRTYASLDFAFNLYRYNSVPPSARHRVPYRFSTPLFSARSELRFSQPLYFHKHLRCPLLFPTRAKTNAALPRIRHPAKYL